MAYDIFNKEEAIIEKAKANLNKGSIDETAQKEFEELLKEYELLAKQNKRLIKLSDRNEKKLRKAKEEIEHQKEELEIRQKELVRAEKMASLGQLVSGVAHELNTPLGIILMSSTSLQKETALIKDLIQNAKAKKSNVTHYLNLAEEACKLLEFHSQAASDLITSFKAVAVDQNVDEKRTFELGAYVHDIIRSLKPVIHGQNVEINIQQKAPIELTSYPGALSQVINNIVLNAYKHGFKNGQFKGEINISLNQTKEQIEIEISDDGQGISQSHLEKIFDPFFTTARESGGTGLGLHIVHNIVSAKIQGQIMVKNHENTKGCCFQITLPKTLKEEVTK